MKPEFAERLFVESLFKSSINSGKIKDKIVKDVEKLTGDASTRRYYRVCSNKNNYVVCLDNPTKSAKGKNEFLEVQKALEKVRIRVPKIYDSDLEKGYILEEDLGDITFLKNISEAECSNTEKENYLMAVKSLIKMQSLDINEHLDFTFTKIAFDVVKLMDEVNFTIEYFLRLFLGHRLKEKNEEKIRASFLMISKKLSQQRRVFTHRDFHSRNIMIKDKEQVIIDFQDARLGIPQYDLVSLLEDCYYLVERKNKEDIKNFYWNEFIKKERLQSSREEFELLYDYMAIQRIFKAIGSFCFIYKTRNDYRYLKYIGFAYENLRSFLLKHEELKELRLILNSIYYEY